MMNVFMFLTDPQTNPAARMDGIDTNFCADNSTTLFIFQVARLVIRIIQIAVPFALIIWGSLDFFKAVIAGDDKEMKQKRKPFVQRVISALVILLLPSLVNVIMKNLAKNSNNRFATCWNNAGFENGIDVPDTGNNDEWGTSNSD